MMTIGAKVIERFARQTWIGGVFQKLQHSSDIDKWFNKVIDTDILLQQYQNVHTGHAHMQVCPKLLSG